MKVIKDVQLAQELLLPTYSFNRILLNHLPQKGHSSIRIYGMEAKNKPLRVFGSNDISRLTCLIHTIPIYLKAIAPKDHGEDDIVDALGAYFPNVANDDPYIELYLETMYQAANKDKKEYKYLYIITLIHELAHAMMDTQNFLETRSKQKQSVRYCTQFGKYREESMANAVALSTIKDMNNAELYAYAKLFMLNNQPPEYALGTFYDSQDCERYIFEIRMKYYGVSNELQQEWIKYVQQPNLNPYDLHWWNCLLWTDKVFKFDGKYYGDQLELYIDIAKKYVNGNVGSRHSDFCSIFGDKREISSGTKVLVPLHSTIRNHLRDYDIRKDSIIHFADGDYVFWKSYCGDDDYIKAAQGVGYTIDIISNPRPFMHKSHYVFQKVQQNRKLR